MATTVGLRLGPVMLITERLEVMSRFYGGLGLSGTHEPSHHTWYQLDGQPFVLHRPDREPGAEYTPKDRGSLIWLITPEDLAAMAVRLAHVGTQVWGPYGGGERSVLYALDPDGNMVGLTNPRRDPRDQGTA
jgi:catechol-2,3-dioxygenase